MNSYIALIAVQAGFRTLAITDARRNASHSANLIAVNLIMT